MVSVGRAAASGSDHDPVRHQQAALRHAQGHHGGEKEGDRDRSTREFAGCRARADASTSSASTSRKRRRRPNSSPARRKKPRRSCSKSCGTKRGCCNCSDENPPDHRTARRKVEQSQLRDAGGRAADRRSRRRARYRRAVVGKGVAALADELAGYQLDEVLLVEHDLLEKYTPDGFTLALRQVIDAGKAGSRSLPAHVSGARFRAQTGRIAWQRHDRRLRRLPATKMGN